MDYKRIYDNIINRAKERIPPEGYIERHHIFPRCMGGSDEKENLVALTPEEHFLCHVILVKLHPEHGGLIYAVNQMCRGHKGKRKSRKLYGWLKRRFSEQRKLDTSGDKNPQHGTLWINKIGTTENKRIKNGESIPSGWEQGRSLKGEYCKISYCCVCGRTVRRRNSYCLDHIPKRDTKRITELRRKVSDEEVKKCLIENNLDIDKTMEDLGYKVSFGNTRYRFMKIKAGII